MALPHVRVGDARVTRRGVGPPREPFDEDQGDRRVLLWGFVLLVLFGLGWVAFTFLVRAAE